jgi:hypothetical protein
MFDCLKYVGMLGLLASFNEDVKAKRSGTDTDQIEIAIPYL